MRNKRLGRRAVGRLAVLAAVLTAVCMLAVPVCAATVTASDVMIRNSGEEKDNNIIGVLQEGDKVTVISKPRMPPGSSGTMSSCRIKIPVM